MDNNNEIKSILSSLRKILNHVRYLEYGEAEEALTALRSKIDDADLPEDVRTLLDAVTNCVDGDPSFDADDVDAKIKKLIGAAE